MANQQHLDILKQGVMAWNQWREEHRDIELDLSDADLHNADLNGADLHNAELHNTDFNGADLSYAELSGADLSSAHLIGADLSETDLSGADLHDADLSSTHFSGADLSGADLSGAHLSGANFSSANFRGANLSDADLIGAHLSGANLRDANLNGTRVGWTSFGNIDLRPVKGLETVKHEGPSYISTSTLSRSQGDIPEVFLQGAGVDDAFITYARSLVNKPIEYYTCFISYSSKDQDFAQRLHADLQSKGVRCWFAPEDLKIGEKFWHRIDESIRQYDKLLVVLSEHSVTSVWVENEVMTALEKEQQQQKLVLFPIKLDETVMQTNLPWAANIRRTRHLGDFTKWKNYDDYQKGLNRLLRDLKAST